MSRTLMPFTGRFPLTFGRLENGLSRLLGAMLGDEEEGFGPLASFVPQIDVAETPEAVEVTVELPGLKPEEVHVEFKDGMLVVSGEKKEEEVREEKDWKRVERRYGEFRRAISLPTGVKEEAIEAHFENGLLKVVAPKMEEAKPKAIPVRTKTNGKEEPEVKGSKE